MKKKKERDIRAVRADLGQEIAVKVDLTVVPAVAAPVVPVVVLLKVGTDARDLDS